MKILFVLEYYHPHIGGVENLFKSLVDRLTENGHEVVILTNRYDNKLARQEEYPNLLIKRYRFYNRYIFTFFAWIPGIFCASGVDLIHTTSYNASIPAWIIGFVRKKKVVITFHEYWGALWNELPWMSGIAKWLHRSFERMLTLLPFERFIAVSKYTQSSLIDSGIEPKRVQLIYNGIDYQDQLGKYRDNKQQNKKYTFTYFGRVGYSKGLDILLAAAADLAKTDKKFILQIITSREALFQKILELVNFHKLNEQVVFRHELQHEELFSAIGQSDCIVIPSYSEGFCYAAVESMAIGTPIISSGRGALKEVIGGKCIELSALNTDELSKAMTKAMKGEWTEKALKLFPLEHTIDAHLALYEQILKG